MKFSVPTAGLREPSCSAEIFIRIEAAPECWGEECGCSFHDKDGELVPLPPHYHFVVTGKSPEAGPRVYPIDGALPAVRNEGRGDA